VQHPVRAVTKINVGGAGLVSLDKGADGWARKCVTRFIVLGQVGFGLDDCARATSPDQLGADELTRARDRIAAKKCSLDDSAFHDRAVRQSSEAGTRKLCCCNRPAT